MLCCVFVCDRHLFDFGDWNLEITFIIIIFPWCELNDVAKYPTIKKRSNVLKCQWSWLLVVFPSQIHQIIRPNSTFYSCIDSCHVALRQGTISLYLSLLLYFLISLYARISLYAHLIMLVDKLYTNFKFPLFDLSMCIIWILYGYGKLSIKWRYLTALFSALKYWINARPSL